MRSTIESATPLAVDTDDRLAGAFVVLTGGSAGIGRALAGQLADRGASVLIGSRINSGGPFEHVSLDLTSFASVVEFAERVRDSGRPIDLLLLNAGVHVPWKRVTTADGHELHWQVNYLSNFLLTYLLLDLVQRSALKQIVYVGSEAHRLAGVPGGSLAGFSYRYAQSKAAAMTFFFRLQKLQAELKVRIVSPGYVATEIHRHKSRCSAWLETIWSNVRKADEAATEILRTVIDGDSPPVYWDRGNPAILSARCRDDAEASVLWGHTVVSLKHLLPDGSPHEMVTNYSRTWCGFGPAIERPIDVDSLGLLVRRAADAGRTVRVVGSRHSYNDCFFSPSVMISLAAVNRNSGLSADGSTVTCEAGVTIGEIGSYLDERGYALRYCGNNGRQTLAGALATGTHGYGREGGLMSELVTAVTLMGADGRLVEVTSERDLRAVRLGLGTLGIVVAATLAVERSRPCVFHLRSMPQPEFVAGLGAIAGEHEYLRYMQHPGDEDIILYLTIDRCVDESTITQPLHFVGAPMGGLGLLLAPWLRMPAVRRMLGRVLPLGGYGFSRVVPFSTSLFVGNGVKQGTGAFEDVVSRIGAKALDRNDWVNMELAIPLARYSEFAQMFKADRPRMSGFGTRHPYYVCRVVGAAHNVLLGPNFDRDVVFVDIHADPRAASTDAFLRAIETQSIEVLSARPHWGKKFFAEHDAIRRIYPRENIDAFRDAKRKF
ncbi:MAG: SDR family NAD(P)-dependent oxidoreductase, partial [Gemmatimonadales bacterium]